MIIVNFKNELQRLKATTVLLEVDRDQWNFLKMFHCHQCRSPLFKYSGSVIMISPGNDVVDLPIVVQCPTCKKNFLIQSIVESV